MGVNATLNASVGSPQAMPEAPVYILALSSLFYGLAFLIGIIGNTFVITVVFAFKRMQSRMNFFFVNLSITDMLILFVCLPSATVDLFSKEVWYFGEFMCKYIIYSKLLTLVDVKYVKIIKEIIIF
jgi:hypothetical protein